ncbi:MAG: dTDP-4-dehydrorhamnose reductase [Verrucomicrobiia bacterium]
MSSPQRVVIAGAGGRLGKAVLHFFGSRLHTVGMDRAKLDLSKPDQIATSLDALEFDLLVNCAALTNVDYCESHREEAFLVNAEAPAILARLAAERHARMFHISTDYVFDGKKPSPYVETDSPNPLSVYGKSKLSGEEKVLAESPDHLNIRVSWVFGPERPSFIDWALNTAKYRSDLAAVGDKFSTPSYTRDLARALHRLAETPHATGTLHLCNEGQCSWREFAQEALNVAGECGVTFATKEVGHIPLDAMEQFVARRPVQTAMSTERFTSLTGQRMPAWQEAVRDFVIAHKVPTLKEIVA